MADQANHTNKIAENITDSYLKNCSDNLLFNSLKNFSAFRKINLPSWSATYFLDPVVHSLMVFCRKINRKDFIKLILLNFFQNIKFENNRKKDS